MTIPEPDHELSAAASELDQEDPDEETLEETGDEEPGDEETGDALPRVAATGVSAPVEEEPKEAEEEEPPKYYISFQRLEELRRSPVVLIASRRVATCPSLSKPDFELTDPQSLVNEIAQHYQDDRDYIRTDMPVMEMVFRILLSRKNEPTSLLELHHEVTDRWATPVRPITITETGLQKIMESDNYYGFARL